MTSNGHDAPPEVASGGGLRYVHDGQPGIRRVRRRGAFTYTDADGKTIREPATLARIAALAIPPAWEDVWICPTPSGHLQATGRDARGRKQYRYHPEWRRRRDHSKFSRMLAFGQALPRIRARVASDLRTRSLTRETVLAAVVRLLDESGLRVGNTSYARENGSYGVTTLRNRHVEIETDRVVLTFRGKGGKEHHVSLQDARLARIVRNCRAIPGYELFQYVDEDGQRQQVESHHVNDYLREIAGQDFTAKDFRTWRGTVLALAALREVGPASSDTQAARKVNEAIREVATALGNTLAVCRASYVHPAVIEAYSGGAIPRLPSAASRWLSREERATLALLRAAERPRRQRAARA